MTPQPVPEMFRALAAVDGEHLAKALVGASARPDWVDQIIAAAPDEVLRDALRHLAVDVVGAMLDSR